MACSGKSVDNKIWKLNIQFLMSTLKECVYQEAKKSG
jgi:hypothetical protein